MRANRIQPALEAAGDVVMRDSSFNCLKQQVRRYRLGQKILGTTFDCLYGCRNVWVAREKYDRESGPEVAQAALKLRAAQSRYLNVEENAARLTPIRQTIKQMLGRGVG